MDSLSAVCYNFFYQKITRLNNFVRQARTEIMLSISIQDAQRFFSNSFVNILDPEICFLFHLSTIYTTILLFFKNLKLNMMMIIVRW